MKVIDLLNKIANGEEVPKKIKCENDTYIHIDNYCYYCNETNLILSDRVFAEYSKLNEEVEIIEEDKKIEKIPLPSFEEFKNMSAEERYLITAKEYDLLDELIEEIEKLKGKSE